MYNYMPEISGLIYNTVLTECPAIIPVCMALLVMLGGATNWD